MSKKFLLLVVLLASLVLTGETAQAANSTLTASRTVINLATGVDDQTAATSSTATAVAQVKASTTVELSSVPTATSTVTFGQCVITLASSTDTTNETNSTACTGNTAHIELRDTVTSTPLSATAIATAIRALTGVTDANHGALTLGGTGIYVSLTTTNAETSATIIGFSTTTAKSFATTTSVAGTVPVVQTETITIGGTVEENDVFVAKSDAVVASYTVPSTATTTASVASGLNAAIQADSDYGTAGFTSSVSGSVITLTGDSIGTAFSNATTTLTNRSARAQVVTFAPANVTAGETFSIIIDGASHSYKAVAGDTVAAVVAGLTSSASGDAIATCVNSTSAVTCTAKTAGVAFTYGTNVDDASSAVGSSGGSGGGGAPYVTPTVPAAPKAVVTPNTLTKTLSYGQRSVQVKILQEKLKSLGLIKPSQKTTTYFGLVTRSAVIKFQKANKIRPATGLLNAKTRSLLNKM